MKYRVNNACIGCGFCASTCPEIFEMNDDRRAVAADREVPPELESAAEEAFTGCPVVVSRTLSQNPHVSVTLFAFDKGEEISTHDSDGDALALVLSGRGRFTVDGKVHSLEPGECVVMPAQKPHALYAEDAFQMLLVVVFPE